MDELRRRRLKWANDVRKRDRWVCKFPGCKSKKQLQAHHIVPWSKSHSLRFEIKNGITLCKKCHDSIKNREHLYTLVFMEIINGNNKRY
jgi:5-methylcytosine-specific restriction endonuclease McrA